MNAGEPRGLILVDGTRVDVDDIELLTVHEVWQGMVTLKDGSRSMYVASVDRASVDTVLEEISSSHQIPIEIPWSWPAPDEAVLAAAPVGSVTFGLDPDGHLWFGHHCKAFAPGGVHARPAPINRVLFMGEPHPGVPLTYTGSDLLCPACLMSGWILDGHWSPRTPVAVDCAAGAGRCAYPKSCSPRDGCLAGG